MFYHGLTFTVFVLLIVPVSADRNVNVMSKRELKFPIVLIPGDGGSQVLAKLNKTTSPHAFCSKTTTDYYSLWLNLEQLVVPALYCFVDNMKLVYDNKTRTTHNTPGVLTKIPGFGETNTVEWIDPSEIPPSWYFSSIVRSLVSWGYKRGKSVRGAPYDFRKAPNEMSGYYKLLTALITETYKLNGNKRVMLISHSMGGLHALYFLNHATQEWKDKYIEGLISISAPWAGCVKSLRAYTSGDNLAIYKLPGKVIRSQQRTMPSLAWVLPSTRFWSAKEPLIVTPRRKYTSSDYQRLFEDLRYPDGYQMYQDTVGLLWNLTAPGVKVYCVHGYGIQTPGRFEFPNNTFPDSQPEMTAIDGDGTVSMRSLSACKSWIGKQKAKVDYQAFGGSGHLSLLNELCLMQYIKSIIFA